MSGKPNPNSSVDMALSALCRLAEEGQTLTGFEIAEVCGCSRGYIDKLERSAIKKLRSAVQGQSINDWIMG